MSGRADELFRGVVCPECRCELVVHTEQLVCTGVECRLQFAIENGIPHLLADSAQRLAEAEWKTAVQRTGSAAERAK